MEYLKAKTHFGLLETEAQAHANPGAMRSADSVGGAGGGRDDSGEESGPGNNHGGGAAAHHAKRKKRRKLPKELETQLVQLLKVLSMIAVVLEQR